MKTNETGRSMVEMLGVLAIIGVLSVGGIAGYTMAMNKYKSNEILNVISSAATVAHSLNAGDGLTSGNNKTLSDLGLSLPTGLASATVTVYGATGSTPYEVKITDLGNTDICSNITAASPSSSTSDTAKRIGWYLGSCS